MGTIIEVAFSQESAQQRQTSIDLDLVRESLRQLSRELISPSVLLEPEELASEHDAEPIKSVEDIETISRYLVEHERWRDNMLFIVGINFGLRVSDLIRLKFSDLIDDSFRFKRTFAILEKKTRNTRKVKRNRYITINDAVMEAVTLYLEHTRCSLDDYMFKSESNRGKNSGDHIHRASVDRILKDIKKELGLQMRLATHSLRKTFGYHQMVMSGNDPRKLLLLQKIFGHSSAAQTLDYIGITSEEIESAYLNLNLGSRQCYQRFGQVGETTSPIGA